VFENRVLRNLALRGTRWQGNGESCITRSWMICTPYQYCAGGKIETNEMSRACVAYGEG
jgi:hypothetical protein